jgi:hypothetical protein
MMGTQWELNVTTKKKKPIGLPSPKETKLDPPWLDPASPHCLQAIFLPFLA